MGWHFPYHAFTRKQLIVELTMREEGSEQIKTTLAHCVRGNVLWSVIEIEHRHSSTPPRRFILCDLMQKREGTWGYKPLSENMGPFYYHCPLKYLGMVPEVTCQEWRDEVIKYHAKRRK